MDIKPLILIVEDDKPIKKFMKVSLEAQGYKCIETEFGNAAISLIFSHNPDIIILDLGLPDIDGLNVIDKVRESTKARIIVVSARGRESEKVEALDKGADDYLTKPFSVAELLARIRVALRHFNVDNNPQNNVQSVFVVKDLKIDFEKRKVTILHKEIHLTPMEYKLIELMSRYAGRVLTHKYIVDEIWGSYFDNDSQSLRVFMANIRRKIEKDPAQPQYIITEVGVGYRLVDE